MSSTDTSLSTKTSKTKSTKVEIPKKWPEILPTIPVGESIPITKELRSAALTAAKRLPGKKFITRKMPNGTFRLFRLADTVTPTTNE